MELYKNLCSIPPSKNAIAETKNSNLLVIAWKIMFQMSKVSQRQFTSCFLISYTYSMIGGKIHFICCFLTRADTFFYTVVRLKKSSVIWSPCSYCLIHSNSGKKKKSKGKRHCVVQTVPIPSLIFCYFPHQYLIKDECLCCQQVKLEKKMSFGWREQHDISAPSSSFPIFL